MTSLVLSSQIAKIDIPPEVAQRWELIPAEKFDKNRAVACYALTVGAWQNIMPTTFSEAMAMQSPSLGGVALYSGDENTVQMLAEMITTASLLMNVGKNLRAEQIYPTASLILTNPEYRIFTVADFRLALNRGVIGKYGKAYDRFDVGVISEWLNAYWQERLEAAENIAEQRHSQIKSQASGEVGKVPEWFLQFVKEFSAKTDKSVARPMPEFEPDALILELWEKQWKEIPEKDRPSFRNYCTLQKLKFKK